MTGDRDPLDILVLCSEKVPPLTLIEARVIGRREDTHIINTKIEKNMNYLLFIACIIGGWLGIIQMIDGDEEDDKIIAVAKGDPKYDHV